MAARRHHRFWHYLLLGTVGAILFLWNLGGATLWDVDEGRNSTCSHEMMESGNWVVPTFNGNLRVDKPALLYWCQIAAYRLFGLNEFAARLPSALAALGAILLAYELGRSLFGKTTGLLTGLIIASTPMLCGAARFANPDALLHFFTLLTLLIFWIGHRRPSSLWWLGLGAAAGMGMLAKGPVGLILPVAVALVFLVWDGNARMLFDRRLGWAVLAWCLIGLPWYVWVGVDTKGEFLRGFLLRHNAERFGDAMEGHSGSPLYYPAVLIIGAAPWSFFVAAGIGCAVLRRFRSAPESAPQKIEASAYRFLISWIATYVLFFTLAATKLPNYVLPVIAPCAALAARFLEQWRGKQLLLPDWAWITYWAGSLLLGFGLATALALAGGAGDWTVLRGRSVHGLAAFAWIGIVPVIGGCVGWILWRRDQREGVLACLAATAVALLAPLGAWVCVALNGVKPAAALVEIAGARQRDADLRIGAWQLEHLPSLNFYVERDVISLSSEKELRSLLRYPLPVFVFLPAATWDKCNARTREWGREAARRPDLYRQGEVVVVVNRLAWPGLAAVARDQDDAWHALTRLDGD
jgi:4-amino-4-deoxy-L-arabinose transferase-like glycosyltransferase